MFYSTCAVGDHACLEFIDDRLVPDFHHCKSDSFNNLTGLTFMTSSPERAEVCKNWVAYFTKLHNSVDMVGKLCPKGT